MAIGVVYDVILGELRESDAVPNKFSSLSGTVWDGTNKEILLTANVALTTTANPTLGLLTVIQDGVGSHTISINGTSLVPTSTASAVTVYALLQNSSNGLFTLKDVTYLAIGAAPTPSTPTITSATATDTNTIVVVFSEAVSGTSAGWSFNNGSALTITGVSGSDTNTFSFTVSQTMTSGDTITYAYNASTGNIVQWGTSSALASASGSVTNSIAATSFLTFTARTGVITESPTHTFNLAANAHMMSDQSMTANGYFQATVGASANESFTLALDHVHTNNTITAPYDVFLMMFSGHYYYNEGAYAPVDTGVAYATGDFYRLIRTGSTILGQYSRNSGVSWTTLRTFTGTYAATMWAKVDDLAVGAGSSIKNPVSIGMS